MQREHTQTQANTQLKGTEPRKLHFIRRTRVHFVYRWQKIHKFFYRTGILFDNTITQSQTFEK